MMRVLFIYIFLIISLSCFSQNTISVKKQNFIEGFYQIEKGEQPKEYIYFDKKGNVVLLEKNYRKNKALGAIQDCLINNDCSDCRKTSYIIEKNNTIVFGFKKTFKSNSPIFTEYRAKTNDDKSLLTVKVSKTDIPVVVKKYFLKE